MKYKILLTFCCMAYSVTQAHDYHVSVTGNDRAKGDLRHPFRTISFAAAIAKAGDQVIVHAGTYREWIRPDHGGTDDRHRLTFRTAKGENVHIKGSEIIRNWQRIGKNVWKTLIPNTLFGDYNPYTTTIFGDWFFPGKRKLHTGEVYLNGKALEERDLVVGSGSWNCSALDDSTVIQANFGSVDPNKEMVEINVRPACFYPKVTGVNYITVRGFHLSQAATQWAAPTAEQIGLIGTNWSKGWVIENNVVSDSKCAGITLGKDRASGHNVWSADMGKDGAVLYNEMILRVIAAGWNRENIGSHLVKNNTVYNCGAAGICGSFGAAYSRILDNEVYNIYTRRNFYGAEMAGIKFHGAIDMGISGNRVHNAFIGLWLDWMAQGTVVRNNVLYENDYVDFFPEVNHGPYTVIGNQFLSAFSLKDWSENGTYRRNVFSGMLSRASQDRATPIFKSHTTEMVSVKIISGGGNRFYDNTFKGGNGKSIQPKMHSMDTMDSLRGYGLAIYKQAALPVAAKRNIFLNGAKPLSP